MRAKGGEATGFGLGDPRLEPAADLGEARRILADYRPSDPEQRELRRRMLAFIDRHPEQAHQRRCRPGHLTASALVLDAQGERALLTHHRKLGRWLQLGGHCDGDANLAGVALREAIEESGIEGLVILPEVLDLDIHPIPARPGEPAHLHLDTRFLVRAPAGAEPVAGHESHAVAWWPLEAVVGLDTDESVLRLVRKARQRPSHGRI